MILRYFDGCPNWQTTLAHEEFLTTGLDYDTLANADIYALVWIR